ncbi:MAG: hypothetical protein ACLPUO_01030 [Streptosporangiaceae bacterium]
MAIDGNAHDQPPALPTGADAPVFSPAPPDGAVAPRSRRAARRVQLKGLIRAIRDSDETAVEQAVIRLSQTRRLLAPLALGIGAFVMLFEGVKLLFTSWRLTLIQVLPAMWIWIALFDLKAHVLHGHTFHVLRGPVRIPIVLAIAAITAACFFLNAVFAFAIAGPGPPQIRPAFTKARANLTVVLGSGAAVGLCLGLSTVVFVRWGLWWFAVTLSIVIGVMMVCYVAVPARLIGVKPAASKRDKLAAGVVGGAIGAVVCTPPYLLGRIGLLMLGSKTLFIPGVIILALGLTLEAGATSAVKAVKMSAKLLSGRPAAAGGEAPPEKIRPGMDVLPAGEALPGAAAEPDSG